MGMWELLYKEEFSQHVIKRHHLYLMY